jgi:malonyl-CoA O-methyltransferase
MTLNEKTQLPGPDLVREVFDRAAAHYKDSAALEFEVGSRLLERVAHQRLNPACILDLGSATGKFTALLKKQFRKAEVIGMDSSTGMNRQLRKTSSFLRPIRAVCADLSRLPFSDRSADLVFSNLAVQWVDDFKQLTAELRRVIRPDGLLLFSTLGPDSLVELRDISSSVIPPVTSRQFTDMHLIGDALLSAGFSEPVVDSEIITIQYKSFDVLLNEIEATGAGTHFSNWEGLKAKKPELEAAYEKFRCGNGYPVSWEIVYGAAFGPEQGQPIKTDEGDVAAFSVDFLRSSRNPKGN